MNKVLRYLLTASFGFLFSSAETQAANKKETMDQCVQAALNNDTGKAEILASEVALFSEIKDGALQHEGTKCLNMVFGDGWYYYAPTAVYLNTDPSILRKPLAGLTLEALVVQLEKLGAMRGKVEGIIFDEQIKDLQKQIACVSVVISQAHDNIEALDAKINKENQSLIVLDTHKACVSLYVTDQPAAMLNQSCIQAFQKIGHPKLPVEKSDAKSALSKELSELMELNDRLTDSLLDTTTKYLELDRTETIGGIDEAVQQEMAAKSCAEFGYDNINLD